MNYTFVYTYFLPVPCINLYEQFSWLLPIDTEKSKISQHQSIRLPSTYFSQQYNN